MPHLPFDLLGGPRAHALTWFHYAPQAALVLAGIVALALVRCSRRR
jgi:hypothetical protein